MKRLSLLLVILTACSCLPAQTLSITDGTTPPTIEPGRPAGSFALSGLESINPYNGHLNFTIPLLTVGGRGEAGYQMSLTIERNWRFERTVINGKDYFYANTQSGPNTPFWGVGSAPAYIPGRVIKRSIVAYDGDTYKCDGGVGAGNTFFVGVTLTRLTYIEANGTEHELRDVAWNGQPGASLNKNNCSQPPNQKANRGRVFVSNDGTSITFIADNLIYDPNTMSGTGKLSNAMRAVSGWLLFPNGVKYQLDESGRIQQILDRNGNRIQFSYSYSPSNGVTITDSLNRTIVVTYASPPSNPNDVITYSGYGGAQRQIIVAWKSLGEVLFPGQSLQLTQDMFGIVNPTSGQFNPYVVASVTLGDGSQYSFLYNCYGELKQAKLPTGGAYQYDHPYETARYSMPNCLVDNQAVYGCMRRTTVPSRGSDSGTVWSVFRRVIRRRIIPDGVNVEGQTVFYPTDSFFAPRPCTPTNGTCVKIENQDAGGNPISQETHHFYGAYSSLSPYPLTGTNQSTTSAYPPWNSGRETQAERIVDFGTGQVGQRTVNTWGQRTCAADEFCWSGAGSILHDPNICQTSTTLLEASPNQTSGQIMFYDRYNNRTDLYEYDYGNAPIQSGSCPAYSANPGNYGAYARHTAANFQTSGYEAVANQDNPGMGPHIRDLPGNQTIYDSSGNVNSKTEYFYDETALQGASGITNQLSQFTTQTQSAPQGGLKRGNPTTARKWISSGNSLSFTSAFDVAGNIVTSNDGNSRPTSIAFGSPYYAFPVQVCKFVNGANRCFQQANDLSTGQITCRTNLNNTTDQTCRTATGSEKIATLLDYTDPLDRLHLAIKAYGTDFQSQTFFGYTNLNTVITTQSDRDAYADGIIKTQSIMDGLGREIESRQYEDGGSYISVRRNYDSMGRAYQVSNPYRSGESIAYTTTLYDSFDRVKSVTTPDGAITNYESANNRLTVTDPASKQKQTTTDALGRLIQVIEDPANLNYATTYDYNAMGSLLYVTQAGLPQRAFAYDWLQRLTSAYNPENGTISYPLYDGNSNLLLKIDAGGAQTSMAYDEMDRLISKTYSDGTSVSYAYDNADVPLSVGRLTAVTSWDAGHVQQNIRQILSYNSLGLPASSSQTTQSQTDKSYSFPNYSYNLAGSLKSMMYPSGRVINTVYDSAGRVTEVKASGLDTSYSSQVAYAPHGGIKQMRLGNNLWEQTCYNSRLQPTGIRLGSILSDPQSCTNSGDLLNLAYGYGTRNNNGNLQSQVISIPGRTFVQNYILYDGLNRLKDAVEVGNWEQRYIYDSRGNRALLSGAQYYIPNGALTPQVSVDDPTQVAAVFANNRWNGAQYESTGNVTGLPNYAFTYDAESRIKTVTTPIIGVISYAYDGEGRRVKKTVNGANTVYVYDAAGRLAMEDSAQSPADTGLSYFTADHLGSTRMVTGSTGAVKERCDYLPFGEEIQLGIGGRSSTDRYCNPMYPTSARDIASQKFTGKERDSETGLDYFLARYYSAAHGRFLSPDEFRGGIGDPFTGQQDGHPGPLPYANIRDPQTLNKYGYVRNSPLRYIDPDGHAEHEGPFMLIQDWLDVVEVKGSVGLSAGVGGQAGIASYRLEYTLVGFEGKMGLGGGGSELSAISSFNAAGKIGSVKGDITVGARVSTNGGSTAEGSIRLGYGDISFKKTYRTNGAAESALGMKNLTDIKVGLEGKLGVGVGVSANLSQAARATQATKQAVITTIQLVKAYLDKKIEGVMECTREK